jgi:hypothetical protein
MLRRRDRRLILSILGLLVFGVFLSVFGAFEIWWDFFQGHGLHGRGSVKGLVGAVVAGPALIVGALLEGYERIRRGPQLPGRHERPRP